MVHTDLDPLLAALHDRGVVNETALVTVLEQLAAGQPLTRDHLIAIFGVLRIYQLMTTHDETAVQLLREGVEAFTNPEARIDVRDWTKTAQHVIAAKAQHG